jgi:hypothetical protein
MILEHLFLDLLQEELMHLNIGTFPLKVPNSHPGNKDRA